MSEAKNNLAVGRRFRSAECFAIPPGFIFYLNVKDIIYTINTTVR
jgi:hypothetical protein